MKNYAGTILYSTLNLKMACRNLVQQLTINCGNIIYFIYTIVWLTFMLMHLEPLPDPTPSICFLAYCILVFLNLTLPNTASVAFGKG